MSMIFAVIGGDMRQLKLAELLCGDGHEVKCFAIDRVGMNSPVTKTRTLADAAKGAQCVILPLPVTDKESCLNSPLAEGVYTIDEVFGVLSPDQIICAGRVPDDIFHKAGRRNLKLFDYFDREELVVLNAVAAVEGAIQIAMQETTKTLFEAKCLVIGFGRLGKLLAHRLRGLCGEVYVAARKFSDLAWIRVFGYKPVYLPELGGRLGELDVIFNTVPARILDEDRLRELSPSCFCMDLASKPGGLDFRAASDLGLKAVWALGLPGEVAPESSGAIIKETIYNILDELGVTRLE